VTRQWQQQTFDIAADASNIAINEDDALVMEEQAKEVNVGGIHPVLPRGLNSFVSYASVDWAHPAKLMLGVTLL